MTFRVKTLLFGSLLGLFWGGDPESHFVVTFELLRIFRGFGGSRGHALSQNLLLALETDVLLDLRDRSAFSMFRKKGAIVCFFLLSEATSISISLIHCAKIVSLASAPL